MTLATCCAIGPTCWMKACCVLDLAITRSILGIIFVSNAIRSASDNIGISLDDSAESASLAGSVPRGSSEDSLVADSLDDTVESVSSVNDVSVPVSSVVVA